MIIDWFYQSFSSPFSQQHSLIIQPYWLLNSSHRFEVQKIFITSFKRYLILIFRKLLVLHRLMSKQASQHSQSQWITSAKNRKGQTNLIWFKSLFLHCLKIPFQQKLSVNQEFESKIQKLNLEFLILLTLYCLQSLSQYQKFQKQLP